MVPIAAAAVAAVLAVIVAEEEVAVVVVLEEVVADASGIVGRFQAEVTSRRAGRGLGMGRCHATSR
jgi:hypothetical protein